MKKYFFLFALLGVSFLCSCPEATKHTREIAVYGYVVDENGNPVAHADVVVVPELTISETGKINRKNNCDKLLEVELVQYNAIERIDHIELIWQTASEMNSKSFFIERKTDYNGEYSILDSVDAAGNSMEMKDYSYLDYDIKADQFYQYRLKLNNKDGSFTYSNPITINTLPFGVVLSDNYPNPFFEYTNINFLIKGYEYYSEIIERSTGQSYLKTDVQNTTGQYQYEFSAFDDNRILRPGIYDYVLHFGDSAITKEMFLNFNFNESDCEIPLEVTKTDENGYFMITYNFFPDDYQGAYTHETGQVIGTVLTTGYSDIIVRKEVSEDENHIIYLLSKNNILIDKTKVEDITCIATAIKVNKQ